MKIRLNLLGAPICFVDDRELADLPAQRTRFALLVYLAMERTAARDEVAAMFWPESDDERSRHALSQSLYELRRVLGDGWVDTRAGRLIVSSDVNVDALDFTRHLKEGRLDAALQLYRGPFLSGHVLPNCKEFQTWVDRQRGQHERSHRKARRETVQRLIDDNQHDVALLAARQWVEVDPFEDEANHHLIELLAQGGAGAEALEHFATYERLLKDELDVAPLEHTRELVRRIRDNQLQPSVVSAHTRLPAVPTPGVLESSGQPHGIASPAQKPRKSVLHQFRRQIWIGLGAAITALALVIDLWSIADSDVRISLTWPIFSHRPLELDTARFVILPFEYDSAVETGMHLDEQILLREALARFQDISLVDVYQTGEWIDRLGARLSSRAIRRMCEELDAGRYVRGRVSRLRDSLVVNVTLFDANKGAAIADKSVRIGLDGAKLEQAFASLADGLLFPADPLTKAANSGYVTHSRPARRAFARAMSALSEWDLITAESELAAAVRADAQHVPAYLWLAQIRSWLHFDVTQWTFAAERAHAQIHNLHPRDRPLAEALVAFAHGDLPAACQHYRSAADMDPQNFAAWYGWADCMHRDQTVLADLDSPSGWRFRTSYHSAVRAYRRAFELLPSVHRSFRASNYEPLRKLLKTQRTALRVGSRLGERQIEFAAYPELRGDTLSFVPHPIDSFHLRSFDVNAVTAAVQRQREIFRSIASSWATAYPTSPEAAEAVAVALELLGDNAALDTLIKARSLTRDDADRVRLAVSEVFLRLKYAAPHDVRGIRRARSLADSVLAAQQESQTQHPRLLGALAVLTGRSQLALKYMRTTDAIRESEIPVVLAPVAMPLLVYAALGHPRDSIRVYEEELAGLIDSALGAEEREQARHDWMLRASYLAMPSHAFRHLGDVVVNDPLWVAYHALARRDPRAAIQRLEQQRLRRSGIPASQLTLDVLYPEAWLLLAANQPRLAADWLDPTLAHMHAWPPLERAGELMEVGAWVRAMALRAELAARLGDRAGARTWARPVVELWRNADPSLAGSVRRLRDLAK